MGPEIIGLLVFVGLAGYWIGATPVSKLERRNADLAGDLAVARAALESTIVQKEILRAALERIAARNGSPQSAQLNTWRGILGFPSNSRPTRAEVNKAYHTLAKKMHPDNGGSTAGMTALNIARQTALKELVQ